MKASESSAGAAAEPISPPPLREPRPEHLPAYLSNGLLGLRVGTIPLIRGLAVVSGLRGLDPVNAVEAFARGPYPFAGDVEVDGHRLSRLPTDVAFTEQRYDFSCGELLTRLEFRTERVTATVEILNLCSRTLPFAVLQRVRVRVDRGCRLTVSAGIDPTGVPGRIAERRAWAPGDEPSVAHGSLLCTTHGDLAQCGAAYVASFEGGDGVVEARDLDDVLAPLSSRYSVRARAGRWYVLRQISVLVPTAMHAEPERQACRLVSIGSNRGFDRLRRENAESWADIWRGRPRIIGATDRWQGIADASFYYLHASAHPSSLFSTAMFGLAYWPNYNYYFGHVMWDIETFAFPPLLLTAPDTARALLSYRFNRLDAARHNAAMHGYAGAQYPWESSAELGEDATPPKGPLVGMEQHVNMSVAHAFAQYVYATGDEEFRREQAWPVVREIATWLASRVTRTPRGFEITNTVGIAENRGSTVDNNAYVNMAASVVLGEAVALAEVLGVSARNWAEIARDIVIPMHARRQVIISHDGWTTRERGAAGATPEALAGMFPFGYRAAPDIEQATLAFHLDRVEPYIGYPMLSAPLGAYAAMLGDRQRAAELFEVGYAEFISEPYSEVNEFSNHRFPDKPRVGPLFANLGGFLTSLLFGLPRLRLSDAPPETWFDGPVTMPAGWDGIDVERVFARGKPAHLTAYHGEPRARLEI